MSISTSRSRTARGWTITALLATFMIINFSDKAVLGLSAISLRKELGLSATQYGLVATSFFFLFSASALLLGFITNRVATKWIILASALIWSVSQLPLLLPAAGFSALLVTRMSLGAAEGPAVPLTNHAAAKWFVNSKRSVICGLLGLGVPLGVIVAAPVLSWVIADYGWRAAFGVTGVVGLIWALVWVFVGKEGPLTDTLTSSRTDSKAAASAGPVGVTSVPSWRVLLTGTWLGSVAGSFAAYWASAVLVAWLPSYLTTVLHYSTRMTGTVIILPWAVMAFGMLGQGLLTQWLMHRGVSSRRARGLLGGACVLLAGAALVVGSLIGNGPVKLALLAVGFGLGGVIIAVGQSTSAEICPSNRRGGVLGTYAAVYSVAGIIAPVLTGALVGAYVIPATGYKIAFLITGLLLLVGGTLATLLVRPERDRSRLAARGTASEAGHVTEPVTASGISPA